MFATAFNPLGSYDWKSATVSEPLLAKASAFHDQLLDLPAGSFLKSIYLHWEVEALCDPDAHYNFVATYKDKAWAMDFATSILGNAADDPTTEAGHTWRRNGHAAGIALAGMEGATEYDFGNEAVTHAGLDIMLAMTAAVALKYGIDVTANVLRNDAYGVAVSEPAAFTHAEAAIVDSYFPGDIDPDTGSLATDVRWDFAITVPLRPGMTLNRSFPKIVGDGFRQRAHTIKLVLEHGR